MAHKTSSLFHGNKHSATSEIRLLVRSVTLGHTAPQTNGEFRTSYAALAHKTAANSLQQPSARPESAQVRLQKAHSKARGVEKKLDAACSKFDSFEAQLELIGGRWSRSCELTSLLQRLSMPTACSTVSQ